MKPTVVMLAPSAPTMNIGSTAWVISEERSMNILTKPSAHIPLGILYSLFFGFVTVVYFQEFIDRAEIIQAGYK